jgi:hypothetical protein
MNETTDSLKSPGPTHRIDELLTTIRDALAQDAPTEMRSAGAIACRAILGALDPTIRTSAPAALSSSHGAASSAASSPMATLLTALGQVPTAMPGEAASPLTSLLGAIGQIPREQLIGSLVVGLRSLFSSSGPAYLIRPIPVPMRIPDPEAET